ncbi:hypothetical protein [[Phormidium] sp. LEGE 05292]|uniref:hypothetical protein n=1 Tax=[Phormidium] sp. LEGE 05292 TaxID=767427 RepID=UPI002AD2A808|nr:hypothetical protein [Phormidium sp. LEGE 05292]
MTTWNEPYTRQSSAAEQKLYQYWLKLVQVEPPNSIIERFKVLFIEGGTYPDKEIMQALDEIITSKYAEAQFKFVLNRCCHILINRWQIHPQHRSTIPQLIACFEIKPAFLDHTLRYKSARRLRELIKNFRNTEQYTTLQRLSEAVSKTIAQKSEVKNTPLVKLINRYPYLYEHCLLSEDSTYEDQQAIGKMRTEAQRNYEIELSQYITHQVRQTQVARLRPELHSKQIDRTIHNPTLLNDNELFCAVKQYVGKVEGSSSYRDLAHSFITHTSKTRTYKDFKNQLYAYLTSSIDPGYGKRQFNKQLYTYLQNTLPHNDSQPVSEFLIIRTCTNLLNFLVVNNQKQPQHFVFIDLVANLGTTKTVGLLLKLVLICRKVKPYLEKRFSILFNHYESNIGDAVMWLIQCLENLNIALSIHFGAIDLSYLSRLR